METAAEKILSIKVKYEDAIDGILKYQKQVEELKEKQNGLKESFKAGEIGQREYNASMVDAKVQMAEAKEGVRVLEKEARNNLKTQKENEGSLKSLRAELSNSTKAYDEMSKAERDGAKGQELRDHINAVTLQLKEAEAETQRFYRNVGNYEQSVGDALAGLRKQVDEANKKYQELVKTEGEHAESTKKAKKNMDDLQLSLNFAESESEKLNGSILGFVTAGNPWAQTAMTFVQQLGSIKNAFMLAKNGAMMLGKQLLVLMANPIVAFLAIVAMAISVLVKGITASEENMNKWKVAMAPLGVVLDFISNLITGLASAILTVVEGGGKLLGWMSKMAESLPIIGKAFEESNKKIQQRVDLQKSQIEYEQRIRGEITKSAERENAISELRAKVTDKEKYSAKERKDALEEAIKLEREQADEKKKIAELNLKNLELEASLAANDADMNNKLAEAKASVLRADTDYNNKIREMNAQRSELGNQIRADEKAKVEAAKNAAKEAATTAKEQRDKEREAIRQAEDTMLALVKDGVEKQRQEVNNSYNRQIEDLKTKIATEKNLTATAKESLNEMVQALEAKRTQELSRLSDESIAEQITKEQKRIELMLSAVKAGSEQEYQLKIQQLIKSEEAELAIIGDGEAKKKEIRELYAGLSSTETDATKLAALQSAMNAELATVEEGEANKLLIKQKYAAQMDALTDTHNNDIIKKQQDALRLEFETKIAQAYGNEEEILRIKLEQKQAELNALQQLEGESIEAFNLRKLEIENSHLSAKQDLADKEADIEQSKFQAISDITNGLASLAEAAGEHSKGLAIASKVLALAEIAINTGKAIAAGIAQAQSVPFPGNIAAIATTVSTVLANIATATKTVKSVKLATGGTVVGPGSGTSDSIPAQLSHGESVLTAVATSMFAPLLSSFNMMGGGVPINVTANNSQAIGEEMLAQAIAKGFMMAPPPVLSVEEFTSVANRTKYVENLGNM